MTTKVYKLDAKKEFVAISVNFNGGPIKLSVTNLNPEDTNQRIIKNYEFVADPYFRKNKHYISSGNILIHRLNKDEDILVVASFVRSFSPENQPNADVEYSLEISAPDPTGNNEQELVDSLKDKLDVDKYYKNIVFLLTSSSTS